MNSIKIVSTGSGDERFLTKSACDAIENAQCLVFRTERHPVIPYIKSLSLTFQSFDSLYETCEDFDVFNQSVVEKLIELSQENPVTYVVSDASTDQTVVALMSKFPNSDFISIIPGVSHMQRCLSLLPQNPIATRCYSGIDYPNVRCNTEDSLFIYELYNYTCVSDCKLALLEFFDADLSIFYFSGNADTGELTLHPILLSELDHRNDFNHLSAIYIPSQPMDKRSHYDIYDLLNIMSRLRAPNGCPWDREQTYESLLTNLLEESYEYIQAVQDNDIDHMADELGDVLLQVVFHSQMASEHGEFSFTDVTSNICQKMIERHPHIFGSTIASTSEDVLKNWEQIKRNQRGIKTTGEAMSEVSTGLPTLLRASKVQNKAAKVNFDFSSALDALKKVSEEVSEVNEAITTNQAIAYELGDLLFSVVNVCRLCKVDGDIALYNATEKFISRFKNMETAIIHDQKNMEDLTLSEMDVYWESEKRKRLTD